MLKKRPGSPRGLRARIIAGRISSPLLAIGLAFAALPLWAQVDDVPPRPLPDSLAPAGDSGGLKADTLLDANTTSDLHKDTTVLADVTVKTTDDSGQVAVGQLSIWLGGIWQHDVYRIDDIFTSGRGDAEDTNSHTRRLEGVIRSRLYDWGEVKAQYDCEARDWKDQYVRWHSRLTEESYTITAGNQKEPMGLDWLSGDDEINGWNAYSAVTLGGNLYYRRFRLSVTALLGYARDSIQDQDDGVGLVARLQVLL